MRSRLLLAALAWAALFTSHSSLPATALAQETRPAGLGPVTPWAAPVADAVSNTAQATASGRARCVININGPGNGTKDAPGAEPYRGKGVIDASIDCQGGPVKVAMNMTLLGPFADSFRGLTVTDTCIKGQKYQGCLLVVCGDTAVDIIDSSIRGVRGARVALCVRDAANVALLNTTVRQNHASGVAAFDRTRLVLGEDTHVGGNMIVRGDPNAPKPSGSILAAGVSALDQSNVLMTGTETARAGIGGNQVDAYVLPYPDRDPLDRTARHYEPIDYHMGRQRGWWNGAAGVLVVDNASMVVTNWSLVTNNRASGDCAGGLVGGSATLLVTNGSVVAGNLASVSGGGLCARDHGRLSVDGGSVLENNLCGSFGCGVLVDGGATAVIHGPVTLQGNFFMQDASGPRECDKVCRAQRNLFRVGNKDTGGGAVAVGVNGSLWVEGPVDFTKNMAYGLGDGVFAYGDARVHLGSCVNFTRHPNRGLAQPGWDVTTADSAVLSLDEGVVSGGEPLSVCNSSVQLGSIMCPPGTFTTSSGCTCCVPGMFDLSADSRPNATCQQCPPNGVCQASSVEPLPGHWRSSNRSVQIHPCPMFNASCRGGQDLGNGTCETGYSGVLCGVCAPGYGATVPFKCVQCLPRTQQLLLYMALACTCLALITYTVHATWDDNKRGDNSLRISDLLKVPITHAQYLVILGGVSAPWPGFLTAAFTTAAAVFGAAGGQSSSLDCWVKQSLGHLRLPASIARQLVLFITPVVVLGVVMLLVVASHVAKRVWLAAAVRSGRLRRRAAPPLHLISRLRVAALVVAFFAYPTLVKASLGMFACLRVDDPADKGPYAACAVNNHSAGYWVHDMNQACFTGWHRTWAFALGLPAVVVICIGAPLAIWLFMWRNTSRAAAADPSFRQSYGFLFRNYVPGRLWWEAVSAAQTVSLVAVSVFHHSIGAYHALLLMCLSLLLSLGLQVWQKPYDAKLLHRLHLTATWCLIASIWLALNMFHLKNPALHTFLGAAMVAVDALFLVWCVVKIVQLAHHTWRPVRAFAGALQRCFGAVGSGRTGSSSSGSNGGGGSGAVKHKQTSGAPFNSTSDICVQVAAVTGGSGR